MSLGWHFTPGSTTLSLVLGDTQPGETNMAKATGKSNKSALIRDYLAAKPQASVGDIISTFQQRGIKVSAALAAKIKYNPAEKRMRQRKTRSAINGQRRRGRPPKRRLERGGKAEAIREAFASLGAAGSPCRRRRS
jgi:hypothetical protein